MAKKYKAGSTRIIFIHGLASKPEEPILHGLWREALLANVAELDKPLAIAMSKDAALFSSAYWANAIPDHIEDSTASVTALEGCVEKVIEYRQQHGEEMHISKSGWIKSKVKKFGFGVVEGLAGALTLKDNVIENFTHEVNTYRRDQYIADSIREPLETALRKAWDKGKKVIVISHSMGTFISYDVLWRFSHRPEPEYAKYRTKALDLLVTMGSPLGDSVLRKFMLIDRWKDAYKDAWNDSRNRFYPTNISHWFNFSAYGDIVCHDADLKDDFFKGMHKHVGGYGVDDLKDYKKLYNPYKNHKNKSNPHKSYGYLIQPKLAKKLIEVL